MNIDITGKGMDVGQSLMGRITEHLNDHLTRYFDRSLDAHVVVSKEHSEFVVDITAHLPGEILKASGEDADAYAAYDVAAQKLFAQVRKFKSKIKDHHRADDAAKKVAGQ